MTYELAGLYHEMIDHLTDALAQHESCPRESTEEGCQRPDSNEPERWDNSGWCVKHERRGLWGKECWRLWAERKALGD